GGRWRTARGARGPRGSPPFASSGGAASDPRRGRGPRRARRGARSPPRRYPAARRKPLAAAWERFCHTGTGDMSMNRGRRSLARVTTFDAVLVGSGINTLTAGALLAQDGWSVCVLERSDRLGGAIRTEPHYTPPGLTRAVMSSAPTLL